MQVNKIFIVLIFLSFQIINAQTLSLTEKEKIISNLSNADSTFSDNYSGNAIGEVLKYKIVEAIPAIINNIWKQRPFIQYLYLEALDVLKSEKTQELTLAYIDSLDHYKYIEAGFPPLRLKVLAIQILFEIGNYSQINFIYEYLNSGSYDGTVVHLLPDIIEHLPQETENAKLELIKIADLCKGSDYRWYAINYIYKYFGNQMLPFIKERFINDPNETNRALILNDILVNQKSADMYNLLYQQSISDQSQRIKFDIIQFFGQNYNSPLTLALAEKIKNSFTNTIYKDAISNFIASYESLQPENTIPLNWILDTLISYSNQCKNLNWLRDNNYFIELTNKINSAKNYLAMSDSINCAIAIKDYKSSVSLINSDSSGSYPKYVSNDAYKFLYYYPQYILNRLPSPYLNIKLVNSIGSKLLGGTLQYYDGGWKDAINKNNGTFSIYTKLKITSLRMTYAYGSQTLSNVTVGKDTVVFQTVNTKVKLQNSNGIPIDQGTIQYYAGAWRDLGSTVNGIAAFELLPENYSFRMTYAYASNDKAQDIGVNSTVVFKTINTQVQLKNSLGNFIDQGTVQYYSGAWRSLGTTTNGLASMELLPNNYSFRMTYAFASNDKQQDINTNSIVIFQTKNAQVQLKNSLGSLIDQGTVQYYSGAWKNFGTTTNGISTLELLPNSYSFRMTYAFASNDKQQDISTNSTVIFQTINTQVQLKNSLGNFIDQGTIQYYSGAWRNLGSTTNGIATLELLPNTYSFRMTYGFISKDISQNIALNNVITYSTVLCTIKVNNSQNQPVNNADVKYYSGAWREIGLTSNGIITKELLPANLSFRVNYNSTQKDITQDISLNNIIVFGL